MMKICLLTFLGSVLLSFSTAAQIYQKPEEPEQVSGNGSSSICCYFDEPSKTAIVERCSGKDSHSGSVIIPGEVWCDGEKFVVRKINHDAFKNCSNLTSVTIPDSVTWLGLDVFCGCSALTAINVAEGNPAYSSEDGVLFFKLSQKERTLREFPKGKAGKYNIPDNVVNIAGYAFEECRRLNEVVIPYGVTNIRNCTFKNCDSLTCVQISNSVKIIEEKAFQGCSSLKEITIPKSVKVIRSKAFAECGALKSITSWNTTPPEISQSTFSSVSKTIPVYVPAESVETYKKADGWSEFCNIVATSAK